MWLAAVVPINLPHWKYDDYQLEAVFDENGSCRITLDGKITTDETFQQKSFQSGNFLSIYCETTKKLSAREELEATSLTVWIPALAGGGNYQVAERMSEGKASVRYFDSSFKGDGIFHYVNLEGISGNVSVEVLSRDADGNNNYQSFDRYRIKGKLKVIAQRRAQGA